MPIAQTVFATEMKRLRLEFPNARGETLVGILELPEAEQPPASPALSPEAGRDQTDPAAHYALFAHCFTCGKESLAAHRISRALARRGIGVLRFDLTGLGESAGDFAETHFSSNIQDLLAAARKLEQDFKPPSLLIGHSLGGTAALFAALQLPSVRAVVTIGAPATADHVRHLLKGVEGELAERGEAEIQIGLKRLRVRRQFLEDLKGYDSLEPIRALRRPLLIFHSPLDTVVDIGEAARLYQTALHPKGFISLDRADHLLSDPEDAEFVAEVSFAWARRYLGM